MVVVTLKRRTFFCVSLATSTSTGRLVRRVLKSSFEDDEAVRELGRQMLETYGYTVLLAGDGVAALELAQNHPHPIQLLMTDILMPKMGGIELAERLSTLRPELKVLYTSGYTDSGGSLAKVAGAQYLQKPYAMEELARALRKLLDSTHAAERDARADGKTPGSPLGPEE